MRIIWEKVSIKTIKNMVKILELTEIVEWDKIKILNIKSLMVINYQINSKWKITKHKLQKKSKGLFSKTKVKIIKFKKNNY